MKNVWLCSKNGKAMTISVGLHLFVLGLVYCIQRTPGSGASSGQAYRIALQPTSTYIAAKHHLAQDKPQEQIQPADSQEGQSHRLSKNHLKNRYVRSQRRQKKPNKATK